MYSNKVVKNWLRELNATISLYNSRSSIQDVLEETCDVDALVNNMLHDLESSWKLNLVNQMNQSKMMPYYKFCFDDKSIEKIYCKSNSWNHVRLGFQIKSNLGK